MLVLFAWWFTSFFLPILHKNWDFRGEKILRETLQHKLTKQKEEVFRLIYKVFHTIQNRNGSLEMNKSVIAWGIEMKSFRKKK